MNIRLLTQIIVKKGNEFLVGTVLGGPELKWSASAWDAWNTRDIRKAQRVARAIGGELWLFNPVAGQLREVRYGSSIQN